jgi:hypothetical protein
LCAVFIRVKNALLQNREKNLYHFPKHPTGANLVALCPLFRITTNCHNRQAMLLLLYRDAEDNKNMTDATRRLSSRNKQQSQRARSREANASMSHMNHEHVLGVFLNALSSKAKQGSRGAAARQRDEQNSSHDASSISKMEKFLMETVQVKADMPPLVLLIPRFYKLSRYVASKDMAK